MSASSELRVRDVPVSSGTAAAHRTRSTWIDAAKGFGITLVVIGHAINGVESAGLLADSSGFKTAHYLIYTFHMPLFFVLCGLLVEERLKRSRADFLQSAFTRIAWPYVVWSTIQLTVMGSLGRLINTADMLEAAGYVQLLWKPISQFWFLYVLFLMVIAAHLIVPRFGAKGLLVLALLVQPLPGLVGFTDPLSSMCWFFPFYALGVLVGPNLTRLQVPSGAAFAVAGAAVSIWLMCAFKAYAGGDGIWSAAAVPAAIAGIVASIALARAPQLSRSWLPLLGRLSMPIFLLHIFFVAGTRIALHKFAGITEPSTLIVLATVAGLLGPAAVYVLAARFDVVKPLALG